MPRKYFEFVQQSRSPGAIGDTGNYAIKHDDYPKCLLMITDLSTRSAIEGNNCLHSIIYDQIDVQGSRIHYQVAMTEVKENKIVSENERKELVEYCWDWWLNCYLQ